MTRGRALLTSAIPISVRRNLGRATKDLKVLPLVFNNPSAANLILNGLESSLRRTKLLSYPLTLGMNLSNICNQRCKFCVQDNSKMETNNWITADIFKSMKWLRFVPDIYLFAGSGEPLVNPHFPEIVKVVREVAPKSRICMFTNGQALNGNNLDATVNYMDLVHISLNAVSKTAFDAVVRGDHSRVMNNLESLSGRRNGLDVELSMVLTKHNQDEIVPMVDLAHDLGFSRVIACYFVPMAWPGNNIEFGADDAPDKEYTEIRADEYKEYAKKHSIGLVLPQDTSGTRACMSPWRTAYISNDHIGEQVFRICCSGFSMNTYMTLDSYTNFKRVWNSPRMQEIRRTVNLPAEQQNTMCRMCREIPRSTPDWIEQRIACANESAEMEVTPFGLTCGRRILV